MAVEEKVYASLSTYNTLTTIVAAKIYPGAVPQAVALPAICFRAVSGARINSLDGYSGLENVKIQIDILSTSYQQILGISTAVFAAMAASTKFLCSADCPLDEYDNEVEVFKRVIDFSVWNSE